MLLQTEGEVEGKNGKKNARMERKWRHVNSYSHRNVACARILVCQLRYLVAEKRNCSRARGCSHKYGKYQPTVSSPTHIGVNPLNPELNPICYLLALLGAHHFLHVSRIRVKLLTFRLPISYIYGAPIPDVSRSHTTTQRSR